MTTKFHHAGIVVPDLEKAHKFYAHLLGVEELFRFEWDDTADPAIDSPSKQIINLAGSAAKAAMLKGENYHLELFEYLAPEQKGNPESERPCDRGIAHIAFQFDDIDAACKRLVDAGGTMHHDPVKMGKSWAIYTRDPFGNIVELMQQDA
jgi:catechol 2,3-dioxygenase-like lactoylglutathione lyase family enzyme